MISTPGILIQQTDKARLSSLMFVICVSGSRHEATCAQVLHKHWCPSTSTDHFQYRLYQNYLHQRHVTPTYQITWLNQREDFVPLLLTTYKKCSFARCQPWKLPHLSFHPYPCPPSQTISLSHGKKQKNKTRPCSLHHIVLYSGPRHPSPTHGGDPISPNPKLISSGLPNSCITRVGPTNGTCSKSPPRGRGSGAQGSNSNFSASWSLRVTSAMEGRWVPGSYGAGGGGRLGKWVAGPGFTRLSLRIRTAQLMTYFHGGSHCRGGEWIYRKNGKME